MHVYITTHVCMYVSKIILETQRKKLRLICIYLKFNVHIILYNAKTEQDCVDDREEVE